jgi:hypothetical protein
MGIDAINFDLFEESKGRIEFCLSELADVGIGATLLVVELVDGES